MSDFVLPKDKSRDEPLAKFIRFLHGLDPRKAWTLHVEPYKKRRSNSANAYLWGVVYRTILEAGQLEGWDTNDIHEFFLGEWSGWEVTEGFGRKRMKPIRRSSKLSTSEFSDYVAYIQRFCADRGIYIPDPNEEFEDKAA